TFWSIIWPQAFRRMIPPLGNQAIVSIKDTSLFSVIGVGELVRQGQVYIANTFTAFEVYFVVALMYLAITLSLSLVLRLLERSGVASACRSPTMTQIVNMKGMNKHFGKLHVLNDIDLTVEQGEVVV